MSHRRKLRLWAVSAVLVLAALSWLTGLAPRPEYAHADTCSGGQGPTITDSPCEGLAGSSTTVQTDLACSPTGVADPTLYWDFENDIGKFTTDEPVTVQVPSSAPAGPHTITANCNDGTQTEVSVTFTVTDPTTTTPTTTPTTAPTTTQTTTKPTSPTTTRTTGRTTPSTTQPTTTRTTTTRPTSTGSTATTASTTATTTATTSSSTTTSSPTTSPTTASAKPTTGPHGTPTTAPPTTPKSTPGHVLKLSSLSIAPGQEVNASGNGCAAGSKVHLSIGGAAIGNAVAGVDGTYRAPLQIASISVGRYTVTAHCGVVLAAAPLDVVLASQVSGDTSTLSIIVFVILLGGFLYRRRLLPQARSTPPTEQS